MLGLLGCLDAGMLGCLDELLDAGMSRLPASGLCTAFLVQNMNYQASDSPPSSEAMLLGKSVYTCSPLKGSNSHIEFTSSLCNPPAKCLAHESIVLQLE